jgi:hypothetical protein
MDSAWNRMNQDEAKEIMQRVEFRYRRINRYLFRTVPLGPGLPITRATHAVGFSHGTRKLVLILCFILSKFNEIRFGVSVSSQIVARYQSKFLSFQICFIVIIAEYPKKGLFDFAVIFGEVSFGVP